MGRGKPIPDKSRLGRIVRKSGLKAYELSAKSQVHNRLLTEYLAGRKVIIPEHAERLAAALKCTPEDIIEPNLTKDLTDTKGRPVDGSSSVKDLPMTHLEPKPVEPTTTLPPHKPVVAPDKLIRPIPKRVQGVA